MTLDNDGNGDGEVTHPTIYVHDGCCHDGVVGEEEQCDKKNSFQRSIGSYRDAPQSVSVVAKLK